jgi:hypothetical protein
MARIMNWIGTTDFGLPRLALGFNLSLFLCVQNIVRRFILLGSLRGKMMSGLCATQTGAGDVTDLMLFEKLR